MMGSQDIPINHRGTSQALNAAKFLKNKSIATIITSPLLRSRMTADIIAEQIKAPVIEITELQEACWGEKEGQFKGNDLWINSLRCGDEIKGAEKYSDFAARIKQGMQKALEHTGPFLIVSHGFVYCVVQEILELPISDLGNYEPIFLRPPKHPTNSWTMHPLSEGKTYSSKLS